MGDPNGYLEDVFPSTTFDGDPYTSTGIRRPVPLRQFSKLLKSWIAPRNRRRRQLQPANTAPCEILEDKRLLTVSNLSATVQQTGVANAQQVDIHWSSASDTSFAEYEIWIDQVISEKARNRKVYYRSGLVGNSSEVVHDVQQDLAPGTYTVWVRERSGTVQSAWISHTFELDDDANPQTPVQLATPQRPQITVIRNGQGAAGQEISEGGVGWVGNSSLYEVWLGKRDPNGALLFHTKVTNVPQHTITLRELALAADTESQSTFSDVRDLPELAQLESGDYEIFIRGINGATNANGDWIGQGPWSRGLAFSFHRVEGAAAVPDNLRVSSGSRLTAEWDPVPHADAYLVSVWRGPEYSSHRPFNVRVQGTLFDASLIEISGGGQDLSVEPGDEFFVRVRAIGSEGMLEGMRPGNFASATFVAPTSLDATDIGAPNISGPDRRIANSKPVLRWEHSANATSYDIWFTSLQSGHRLFLAANITDNVFHLSNEALLKYSNFDANVASDFDPSEGLSDGQYRAWVRGRNSLAAGAGTWSTSYDFTVDSSGLTDVSAIDSTNPALQPLVSPNLIESYIENGQQNILITNGLGESFGASVLARFVPDDAEGLKRPVVTDVETGIVELRYPDLPVGNNVTDMAFLDETHLVVLSRGSSDVRVIDLVAWKVISEFSLLPGASSNVPDVMDLEVLSNGQIMIVANRSDRLRLLQVDSDFKLSEVIVAGATTEEQGIQLPNGRAVQVSAVAQPDGTYAVFLATPSVQGIIRATYSPGDLTLTPIADNDGNSPELIRRSLQATPHLGGQTVTIASSEGASDTFYLSTDRNGCLTWVNVDSGLFGFIDMVSHIDKASRDPQSPYYLNPNDARVDPSRIVQLDGNNIAVTNNRASSVILQLHRDQQGRLSVRNSSTFDTGYGTAVLTTSAGTKLYSTAGSGRGLEIGWDNVVVTDITFGESDNNWIAGALNAFVLADPIYRGVTVGDDSILLEFYGPRRAAITAGIDGSLDTRSMLQLESHNGAIYDELFAPIATFHDADASRLYLATRLVLAEQSNKNETHFLGIVDITNPEQPSIHSVHQIDSDLKWYSADFNGNRIAVLDRLGSELVTVSDWNNTDEAVVHTTQFDSRHPSTYGEIRSGRIRTLPDGTDVVLHDTAPDKVFAVYEPGKINDPNAVATIHTNTAGQWIYDVHVFDRDRVIAVTWDAKVIILNVRTGVFETVKPLDNQANLQLDLFGVRETAFRDGRLSVASPGNGVVAEFQIQPYKSGVGHDIQLVNIVDAPNVVSTLLTSSGQWVIEANRVRHYAR